MKENENSNIVKPGFETLDEVLKNLEKSQSISSMGYSSKQTFYSSSIIDENASLSSDVSYIRHSTPKSRSTCSNRAINEDGSMCDEDYNYECDPKIVDDDFKNIIGRMLSDSKNGQSKIRCDDSESMSSRSQKKAVSFNLLPEDLNETYKEEEEELESDLGINRSYKILDKLTNELTGTFDKINDKQPENVFLNSYHSFDTKKSQHRSESLTTEEFNCLFGKMDKKQPEKVFLNNSLSSETRKSLNQSESFMNEGYNGLFGSNVRKQPEKVFLNNSLNSETRQSELFLNNRVLSEKLENMQYKEDSELFLDKLADCINRKNAINLSYTKLSLDAPESIDKYKSVFDLNQINSQFKNDKSFLEKTQSYDSFNLSASIAQNFQNKSFKVLSEITKLRDFYISKHAEPSMEDTKSLSINSDFTRSTNISPKSTIGLSNSKSENHLAKLNSSNLKSPTLKENYMNLNFFPDKVNFEFKPDDSKIDPPIQKIKDAYSDANIKASLRNVFTEIIREKSNENKIKDTFTEVSEISRELQDQPLTSKYNLDNFLLKEFSSSSEQAPLEDITERSKKVTFKLTKPLPALNIKDDVEESLKKNLKPLGYGLLIMDLSKLAEKNISLNNHNLIFNKSKKFILKNVPIFKKDVESYSPIKRIEIYS